MNAVGDFYQILKDVKNYQSCLSTWLLIFLFFCYPRKWVVKEKCVQQFKICKSLWLFCFGILHICNLNANNFAYIIVDGNTGKIMAQHKADELRPPASLVKQMTLYLIFEALHEGKITLKTEFKVSKRATIQEPCKLGLCQGAKISDKNIIYALVTRSANDMAVTIAEGLAGSVEDFCALMNKKAKALGMTKTRFYNPHGLPARGQITSARDMMILARALHSDYPKEYAFFKIKEFRYGGKPVHNHNRMLRSFTGMDGIKTGFTFASRFNISASAQRIGKNGKPIRVFAVVLGGQTSVSRDRKTAELMESAFRKLNATPRLQKVSDSEEKDDVIEEALDNLIEPNETEAEPVVVQISSKKKHKKLFKSANQHDELEKIMNAPTPQPMNIKMEKSGLPSGWVKGTPG